MRHRRQNPLSCPKYWGSEHFYRISLRYGMSSYDMNPPSQNVPEIHTCTSPPQLRVGDTNPDETGPLHPPPSLRCPFGKTRDGGRFCKVGKHRCRALLFTSVQISTERCCPGLTPHTQTRGVEPSRRNLLVSKPLRGKIIRGSGLSRSLWRAGTGSVRRGGGKRPFKNSSRRFGPPQSQGCAGASMSG